MVSRVDRPREVYRTTKVYDHSEGLSCCFRNWRSAHPIQQRLHGSALAFRFVFAAHELDRNNQCLDLAELEDLRRWLHEMFDHTTLVANDDPKLVLFEEFARQDLIDLRILTSVGGEGLAMLVFDHVDWMIRDETGGRVWLESAEVSEHGGNSVVFERPGS
jgi:6-pyruvoyltetrahydropterin/6-carboxytetrahydropterin synthase